MISVGSTLTLISFKIMKKNRKLEEAKKVIITLKRLGWEVDDIQRFVNLSREQIVTMTYGID